MRKPFFVIGLALIVCMNAFGQTAVFRWSDELCEYQGTYDKKKYTEAKLRNTHRLLSNMSDLRLSSTDATVWSIEDIDKQDVAKVDADYKKIITELETLDYVSTPFTDRIRSERIAETRQLYQLIRTTMLAYKDPRAIRSYKGADSCKADFGEPLIAGGEKLVDAWRRVNLASQGKNADPQRLQARWDEQNASPDRLRFALVETMSFGWWNCANQEIKYVEVDSQQAEREFRKLFIRVKDLGCDEP